MSIKIAISILNADFRRLEDQIRAAEAGGADLVHVDVMDGHFVPNLSLGPPIVEAVRACTTLPIDVHLMVDHPEPLLDLFTRAGATRLIVHQEAAGDTHQALRAIHQLGVDAGLAISPSTPLEAAHAHLRQLETLLVMTVHPGFGGQALISSVLEKVSEARRMLASQERAIELQIDGGVKLGNIRAASEAGAQVCVAGTSVFHDGSDPAENVRALRLAASRA